MTTEREFQAAAKGGAMNRGDHRLAAAFNACDHLVERRRLRRLAEFCDIGTGDECAPGTGDDNGIDRSTRIRGHDVFENATANGRTQRIDWRRVDGDHHTTIGDRAFDDFAQFDSPFRT